MWTDTGFRNNAAVAVDVVAGSGSDGGGAVAAVRAVDLASNYFSQVRK